MALAKILVRGNSLPMTKDAIYKSLHAEPFKPFYLRLTDGSVVAVPHPNFMGLSPGGRTAVVFGEGENLSILDTSLVTAIEVGPLNGPPAPNGD